MVDFCTLSGILVSPDGEPFGLARVVVRPASRTVSVVTSGTIVAPVAPEPVETGADGSVTLILAPGLYKGEATLPNGGKSFTFDLAAPDLLTAPLQDYIGAINVVVQTSAQLARDEAVAAAEQAGEDLLQVQQDRALAQAAAENAQMTTRTWATWAALSGTVGTAPGQVAEVLDTDAANHTDPVVGGDPILNAGLYTWSASPAGWTRLPGTGLSGKASTADLDAEIDRQAREAGGPPPAAPLNGISEIAVTLDGLPVLSFDALRSVLLMGSMAVSVIDTLETGFSIQTSNRLEMFYAGDGHVDILNTRFEPSEYNGLGVATRDGGTAMLATDAGFEFVAGPSRLTVGRPNARIPGGLPGGVVTDVTRAGEYWQYRWNGNVVIVHDTGDQWAPHLIDTPQFCVFEANGQSWIDITINNPVEIDLQDPTGMTKARVTQFLEPTIAVTRRSVRVGAEGSVWDQANPWLKEADSTQIVPLSDFHRVPFPARFGIGWVAAAVRAHFQREFRLPQRACIVLGLGRSGNSADKFIPPGTSFTSTAGTVYPAQLVAGASEYLWTVDRGVHAEVAQIVRDKYHNRELVYDHIFWMQGTYTDPGAYRAFLDLYREQQDLLNLPTVDGTGRRAMFIDQRAASYDEAQAQIGAQEQLEWAQTNEGGKNFLVAPRYWLLQRDGIHHTAYDAVRYGETGGLAVALYELTGKYEPWWITGLTVDGSTVRVHTNAPIQGGAIVTDTATLPTATGWGFQIRDADAAMAQIALSGMAVDGSDIVLSYGETMAGRNLQFNYAFRGAVQPLGTPTAPNISACWGNMRREGVYVGPFSALPIHQWLCSTRLNITA